MRDGSVSGTGTRRAFDGPGVAIGVIDALFCMRRGVVGPRGTSGTAAAVSHIPTLSLTLLPLSNSALPLRLLLGAARPRSISEFSATSINVPIILPFEGEGSHAFLMDVGVPMSGDVGAVECVNMVVLSADNIEHDPSLVVVVDCRDVYAGRDGIAPSPDSRWGPEMSYR